MWDNTETDQKAESDDPLANLVIAILIGTVLGAVGFIAALSAGVRVPGLWG